MRLFIALCFLTFNVYAQPLPQITCKSVGIASCATPDGMCLEYFAMPGMDTDMMEKMCLGMDGAFRVAACDRSDVALSCLNSTNMFMPLTFFSSGYDLDQAAQTCSMMGGKICPK